MREARKARLNRFNSGYMKAKPVLNPIDPSPFYRSMWFAELVFGKAPAPRPVNLKIEDIQRAVAKHFGISVDNLISRSRINIFAHPRQVAVYLCHLLTLHGSSEIGRRFDRDHASVIHAIKKIRRMAENGTGLGPDAIEIKRKLGR